MNTYVLIHGAWHGSCCWNKVAHLLEQAGHKVIAPDLPSHGDDKTPISEVTLQSYSDRVCEAVKGQIEPVILVGHSMGGIVITQAAEQCPFKIEKLVYLCAFLLKKWRICMGDGSRSRFFVVAKYHHVRRSQLSYV